jgi:cobalt-zinc-cadmium resistance protein CzcA
VKSVVSVLLRYRPIVLLLLAAWLALGVWAFQKLDIEAYPDPSPPLVEVITQNPAWSAEEMEQQVTVPVETALNGIPRLQYVRSISEFGLSDVKLYFEFGTNYFEDRQEVLNRLQTLTLPNALQPQLSPWSPIGEVLRFQVVGQGQSLNELKAAADWTIRRELKQVPGIIDVTTFGGTTRQYQAEVDPGKLLQYKVTLPEVVQAVQNSNVNAGGSYIDDGSQNVNVRGIGLLRSLEDMAHIVITQRNGTPVFLSDVADVHEGHRPPLGQVGVGNDSQAVEGIVLLQRGEQSMPAIRALHARIEQLNQRLLPPGIRLRILYDRTDLIHITTRTVRHVIITGLVLVTVLLLVFLGNVSVSLITALTIPLSVLFAFAMMVLTGHSANLISIGAIDFGILVDAALVVLEHIYRSLELRQPGDSVQEVIAEATATAARPVMFSTLIIVVAFIPLFTMQGVPGKIFAPMSVTYGFALAGALLFSVLIAPVLASWIQVRAEGEAGDVRLVRWLRRVYSRLLESALAHRQRVLMVSACLLAGGVGLFPLLGGEFMPKMEEGNIWLRATLPQDISFDYAGKVADEIRADLGTFPEVRQVISHVGRPDDGTDASGFNNLEFMVDLKPPAQWPRGIDKGGLIASMNGMLQKYPGVTFNFSQSIQDNVEEAMSGVKGENSLKLFGDDIDVLTAQAEEIRKIMSQVPGIADLGVFKVNGQPNLLISIDRSAAARNGISAADLNAAVQAAIGGISATEVLEGDRRFDFVVRYQPRFRQSAEAIRNILLPTSSGHNVPLGQVATVTLRNGAFMVYRENDRRYLPIKFSIRGRDLATTMEDLQDRLRRNLHLPPGYTYEWAGEYDSLRREQRRLMIVVPVSLAIIAALLYMAFDSAWDAAIVLLVLPFGAVGGIVTLLLAGTPFSISAAVGFASALGVGTLAGLVLLSAIRREERQRPRAEAVREGALQEMRPVLMACLAAGSGLLPAALSNGIGSQAQQPLARVVVGAMVATVVAVLVLIPLLASFEGLRPQETAAFPTEVGQRVSA